MQSQHTVIATVLELFGLSPCPHPIKVPRLHDRFEKKVSFEMRFSRIPNAVKLCEVHVATALMLHDILLKKRES